MNQLFINVGIDIPFDYVSTCIYVQQYFFILEELREEVFLSCVFDQIFVNVCYLLLELANKDVEETAILARSFCCSLRGIIFSVVPIFRCENVSSMIVYLCNTSKQIMITITVISTSSNLTNHSKLLYSKHNQKKLLQPKKLLDTVCSN